MTPPPFTHYLHTAQHHHHPGIHHHTTTWTWHQAILEARRRITWAQQWQKPQKPLHIGLLQFNSADYLFWQFAAALGGFVVVGLNPTRRGQELEHDIAFTDCSIVLTDSDHVDLLTGLNVPPSITIDDLSYADDLASCEPAEQRDDLDPAKPLMLVLTSGTTSGPKAVIVSNARLGNIAVKMMTKYELTSDDVLYCAMPMFHSNALMANTALAVAAKAKVVIKHKFSASGFLPDIRKHKVTYFNYVGKPLHYILATPQGAHDAENTLRLAMGNEATDDDIVEFARRFDCEVQDAYGSSEGGIYLSRPDGTPPGSLGLALPGIVALHPDTGQECPPAQFDTDGHLLNADEAIGELVNLHGADEFEGYYNNADATAEKVRDGVLWSGDLVYRDDKGYFYFAGRTSDWLRVDGENFAAAPVERVLQRFSAFGLLAVYAVPDPQGGDALILAAERRDGHTATPEEFGKFLDKQPDLGTKWRPSLVRIVEELPKTATTKILKRELQQQDQHEGLMVWQRQGTTYVDCSTRLNA